MRGARKRAVQAAAGLAAGGLLLAGCGGSGASGGPAPAGHPSAQRFLRVDAAARSVRITLAPAYDHSASDQNVDGATKGALLFSVPVGWKVEVECVNDAGATRYACALRPAPGTRAAQAGIVYVVHPAGALAPGRRSAFHFTARAAGGYRMVAVTPQGGRYLVPAAMWVVLRVSRGGSPRAQWLR